MDFSAQGTSHTSLLEIAMIRFKSILLLTVLLGGCSETVFTSIPTKVLLPSEEIVTEPEAIGEGDPKIPDGVEVGGVQGRICAPSQNQYVADAKVMIEHQYGVSYTFTDADGYFLLDNIPEGTYRALVQKGSFQTFFDVYIPPNEIIELAEEECLVNDLNVAVVTGEYDHRDCVPSGAWHRRRM